MDERIKKLASYVMRGDEAAADELARLLPRKGYGDKKAKKKSFGFEEVDLEHRTSRPWRLATGQQARVSLAWWPGSEDMEPDFSASSPRFSRQLRHYLPGVGYFLNRGPEYTAFAEAHGGQRPREAYVTAIIVWHSLRYPEGFTDYDIYPWVLNSTKIRAIRNVHETHHLGQWDLGVFCEDTQYQRMHIMAASNGLFLELREMEAELAQRAYATILKRVQVLVSNIDEHLGRSLSLEELTQAVAPNPLDNSVDDIFQDLGDL